jgi:hypothetical protein
MAAFEEYANGNVMRFQRELAHYLGEFTAGPNNVYIRLIREISSDRVIFCSLNYDLLFELSAGKLNRCITYSSEKSSNCIRLLKPHGSSNFWPDMGSNLLRNCTFEGNAGDIEAPVRPLSQFETIQKCLTEDSLSPAIALYAEGKKKKVCRAFVDDQQRQWTEIVKQASKVCIIGTRVFPPDVHIWGVLAASKADVYYYGASDSDRNDFEEWKKKVGRKNIYFVKADFESSVALVAKVMKA